MFVLSVKSRWKMEQIICPPLHPPPLSARHTNIPYGQKRKIYLLSDGKRVFLFHFCIAHTLVNELRESSRCVGWEEMELELCIKC